GQVRGEAGLLTSEQGDLAVHESTSRGKRLGAYLVEAGITSAEDVAMALSLQLNLPLIDLKRHAVQPEATALIPEAFARQHDLIPVDILADGLLVVMAEPGNLQVLEDLKSRAKLNIRAAVGIPADIAEAIQRHYRATGEIEHQVSRLAPADARPLQDALTPDLVAQTPIVRTVELLIAQGVRDRASDIHIEPQADHLRIRHRIDGILHDVQKLDLSVHPAIVSRLKVLGGLNIAERRRPQDGQFSVDVDGKQVDFRIASIEVAHGEMAVLRVLDKSLSFLALSELGMLEEALERYSALLKTPFGMILAGGPTGSGKTTTLYASVNQLDRESKNIITIEDPIEYQFADINQIQINPRAGLDFAGGLRSILRLDPDVILVGEARDSETAKLALEAALTGHLVLSSIHANDAVGVLFRLVDLGADPFLISSALVGIVAQRMVRRVCPHCGEEAQASVEEQAVYQQELGESRGR
ncbi:MAG: GspE/PulE family protein, partial [Dehalococcoidia bacterium]